MKKERILRFLEWFCPPPLYESIEGDLLEQFEIDYTQVGEKKANRRLLLGVLKFFRPEIILRNRFTVQLINTIMIGNYFKVAARNIQKRKLYSFINAFGLSIGIAFCVMIYLFIQDERSFDQFHTNKNSIYRIHTTGFSQEKHKKGDPEPYESHVYLPAKLAFVMQDELAEVQYMTRYKNWGNGTLKYGDKVFKQNFAYVDSGFFKMFSFKILSGSAEKIFQDPSDVVMTPATAKKYFDDEDPIGKIFSMEFNGKPKTMRVAALIEAPPANSSIDFEMLIPLEAEPWFSKNLESWGNFSYPTFVQLHSGTDEKTFKAHLDTLTQKYMGDKFKKWRQDESIPKEYKVSEFDFMKLTDIHLNKDLEWAKVSDPQYSWILGGIAIMILVIACINYISLALTTSTSRRIEVGIRKAVGAQKKQLVYQFGFESLVLAVVSMLIGLGLVFLFLPFFNEFTNKGIELSVSNGLQVLGVTLLITVVVGLLAGSYPSFFLSRFLPAHVLKGNFSSKLQVGFTKPLVVFQFFLSASLIICASIMYQQMQYITKRDLGFNKEQILVIPTQTGWNKEADRTIEQFRNAVKGYPSIVSIAGVSSSFNKGWSRYGYRIKDEHKSAYVYAVDTEYLPLLDIELVMGRNFDPRIASDTTGIIVNEALVRDMNWKDPLNEHLNWREDSTGLGAPIIGVVKDYHFLSLEQKIEPMFLSLSSENVGNLVTMLVKITPGDLPEKVEFIKKKWTSMYPDRPFEHSFVDEDVARQYESYTRWTKIMGLSTAFAIIIACLGLFGLAGINAVNRTKEIGIRKVMGAELINIFMLLNKQYIWLAIIAFVLAAPVSWYAMSLWLDDFQFKISMGWELFAVSMLSGLTIAMITVSYHAIKAALVNPAETLKYE